MGAKNCTQWPGVIAVKIKVGTLGIPRQVSPIIHVLIGTHVWCLLRDRRRVGTRMSLLHGELRGKLVPRWENPCFSI